MKFISRSVFGFYGMSLIALLLTLIANPPLARSAEGILDYDEFMRTIQPYLLSTQYSSPSAGTTCLSCHGVSGSTAYISFPLVVGEPRNNFNQTVARVTLDNPDTSSLLLKPLAIAAGGVPHGLNGNDAGEQFSTTDATAYKAILTWITNAKKASAGARITKVEPHPNPFRYSVDIVYFLSTNASDVLVSLYSEDGKFIRSFPGATLVGANKITWNGRDADDEPMPTGNYIYRVKAQFDDGTVVKNGMCVYTP